MPPAKGPLQMRLERFQACLIDMGVVDAEDRALCLARATSAAVELVGRAEDLEIAGAAHHAQDAGLTHELLVLDDAALNERQHRPRACGFPFRG